MKLSELKEELGKSLYFEDTSVIDVLMASTISFRVGLIDPMWLLLVGSSSSGKSQLLRPFEIVNPEFVHAVDDLTENTFLSGAAGKDPSLLKHIGPKGILLMSDMTILFSKPAEQRNAIFAQMRGIYDGKLTKRVGTSGAKVLSWEGSIQILGGSTPTAYRFFADVADMGERFLYYFLKPVDPLKMARLAVRRTVSARELDKQIAEVYKNYMRSVMGTWHSGKNNFVPLDDRTLNKISECAVFVSRFRIPVVVNEYTQHVTHLPYAESPARVAIQLKALATGFSLLSYHESGSKDWALSDYFLHTLERCAWSMGSNERRAILSALAPKESQFGDTFTTHDVSGMVGLHVDITFSYLQQLAIAGLVRRLGQSGTADSWSVATVEDFDFVQRVG